MRRKLSVQQVRQKVEAVEDPEERYMCKLMYLTGARVNEACSVGSPSFNVKRPRKPKKDGTPKIPNVKTRAVGPSKSDVSYDTFSNDYFKDVRVLKIRMQVLKRKSKNAFVRIVGLPLDEKYEPWALDLKSHFDCLLPTDKLLPVHSVTVNRVLQKHGFYDMVRDLRLKKPEERIENPMRDLRYTHVVDYYGFDPWQAPVFFGHKLETSISGGGGPMDTYAALAWRRYFPALLKPLPIE